MKAAPAMPKHGGARNKAGCPKKDGAAGPSWPASITWCISAKFCGRRAQAMSVEEARFNREARALREVDRPEREAT
jgi:hypothetical protein